MRKKSLLFAAIAAMLMSACSKDPDTEIPAKNARVEIVVSGKSAASTRATGTLATLNENTITNVTVGLFKLDGTTDNITEGALIAGKITVTGTAGDRDIIVVANAPTGTFAGALTKDEFRQRALSLTQVKTMLPMSGESTAPSNLVGGITKSASVEVSRLVARIQIVGLNTAFSAVGQYANASFTLDKVFLYNAMSTSQVGVVAPATTLVTSDLIHGWTGPNEGTATTNIDLVDKEINTPITSAAYTTPYYFYAFQNYFATGIDDTNKGTATKLVIAGWFTPNKNVPGTKFYVYYPAVINRSQAGTNITGADNGGNAVSDMSNISNKGIVRNNIYSIDATIKSIGVDSPEKFMEPAALELGVTVADWNLTINQKIDF
ncbi:MAG: Major fimbrial subunit protein (FimA) [Bacteroidetes bacterium]|nr:Major fimbrial subunit protein (FimA) [Bacteroidota bacterium]